MLRYSLLFAGAICASATDGGTPAPKATETKPAAAAAPKPHKLGPVTVQGSIRTRMEAWDWFQGDSGDSTYAFSGNILRLSFSQSFESWDWTVEMAAPFLLGLPDNAVAPGTQGQLGLGANYYLANGRNRNAIGLFPKQAFVRFRSLGGSQNHTLKLGRYEFMDGSEMTPKNATLAAIKRDRVNMRLLGHFGWTHVGRSFDGFHYSYNRQSGNFTVLGGIPTRGVFQTDGWGWNRTAFGYASYTRPWGKGAHAAETRVFGLHYHDWRKVLKTDSRALVARRNDLANIRVATFGGHSVHAFDTKAATYDLLFWGSAQTGQWGLIDHRGHAIDIEAGIQPKFARKWKPWIRGGYYDGSGDGDPNDGTHNTFFQVMPTPRPFARFPFFDMVNNRDYFGIFILRPHAKVTLSAEFHALRLSNRNDLWYLGGGVFQPWTFGYVGRAASGNRSLANLYDGSVEYRMNATATIGGYFGHAQGRAVTSAIYPKGKNGNFGYVEVAYRF
ncbi:MAG: alginate export family protein [Bryobacterales bacterium]|nr:alginate export family protein [Bryobacterales bacterium]